MSRLRRCSDCDHGYMYVQMSWSKNEKEYGFKYITRHRRLKCDNCGVVRYTIEIDLRDMSDYYKRLMRKETALKRIKKRLERFNKISAQAIKNDAALEYVDKMVQWSEELDDNQPGSPEVSGEVEQDR